MAITTHEVIYLGNFADADTDESTVQLENASVYQQSFGSAGSPLNDAVETITFDDANNDGSIETDNFGGETTTTAAGTTVVDSLVTVSMDVTYLDGTTESFTNVLIFQTADGDMFLANSDWAGGDIRGPDMKLIQSVNVTSVTGSGYSAVLQNNFQSFACFMAGTQLDTPDGAKSIEDLRVGDLVETLDHGPQPLRWIGKAWVLSSKAMAPICIGRGALGAGVPKRDLYVSPQHRMMLRSPIVDRMTGTPEALVAAKALLALPSVSINTSTVLVHYFHIMFDHHEVVFANGAWSESLLPRDEGLKMLGADARSEVLSLFPELADPDFTPPSARPILAGKRRSRAIKRHLRNEKKVFQPAKSGSRSPKRMTAES